MKYTKTNRNSENNKDAYDIVKGWHNQYIKENPQYKDTYVGNGQILFWLAQKEIKKRKGDPLPY